MREDVLIWWRQAQRDIKSAKHSLSSKDYYLCVFMCQQAVEKAFKALHIQKTSQLEKTHDLVYLAKNFSAPEGIQGVAGRLSRAYIETRYPTGSMLPSEKFSRKDAQNFVSIAKEVLLWTRKMLS